MLKGRPCCARCFTPWMCALVSCGCHVMAGATCGFCGVGLFIMTPDNLRPERIGFEHELAHMEPPRPGRKRAVA